MHISVLRFSSRKLVLPLLFACILGATGCASKKSSPQYGDGNTNIAVSASQRGSVSHSGSSLIGKVGSGSHVLAMARPTEGVVLSPYGVRNHPTLKKRKMHKGIDFSGKRGDDIFAAASGTVSFSGWQRGYGRTVEIDHGNGMSTLYAHMNEVLVEKGARVKRAEKIGEMGSTGRTTGPNLHFEVKKEGAHMNPLPRSGWTQADTTMALYGKRGKPSDTVSVASASKSGEKKAQSSAAKNMQAKNGKNSTSKKSLQAKGKKNGKNDSVKLASASSKQKSASSKADVKKNSGKKRTEPAVSANKKGSSAKVSSVKDPRKNAKTVAEAKQLQKPSGKSWESWKVNTLTGRR